MPCESDRRDRLHRPLPEKILRQLGFVEILPEEAEQSTQIRWSAYQVRTALRQGQYADYIIDPHHQLESSPHNQEVIDHYFRLIKQAVARNRRNSHETGADPYLNSILRRLNLPRNFQLSDKNVRLAAQVLHREVTEASQSRENPSSEPSYIIIAHQNIPHSTEIIDSRIGSISNSHLDQNVREIVHSIADTALFASATPYMGAAVIMAELEKIAERSSPPMHILDYTEFNKPDISQILDRLKPKLVFITGTLSFDIPDLNRILSQLNQKNIPVIIGGLGPTIDPLAVAKTAPHAHIFIGEAEGAMEQVVGLVEHAPPGTRYIFRRAGTPETKITPEPILPNTSRVDLNLPPLVDLNDYYGPERERSGQLRRRLHYQTQMCSVLHAFGKHWDSPVWLMHQIQLTRGCPEGCPFCSTAIAHGKSMRRIPIESVRLEAQAVEAGVLLVTDQNLGAQNRSETDQEWASWFTNLVDTLHTQHKKIFCQTGLDLIDRISLLSNSTQTQLKQVLIGFLSGIEQPNRLKGSNAKSSPDEYPEKIWRARELGIIVVATAILGLPKDFTVDSNASSDISEWIKWVRECRPDILIAFPFINIPGAPGVNPTDSFDPNPLEKYQNKYNPGDVRDAAVIGREFYRLSQIVQRLGQMKDYSLKRKLAVLFLNLAAKGIYWSGLDAIRTMKQLR